MVKGKSYVLVIHSVIDADVVSYYISLHQAPLI
jgi:hypothetical protein